MPIKNDPQKGGTNSDGSQNVTYCSYCYQNGEFIFNGTVKEMQAFCKQKMVESGSSKFIAWLFTTNIPRLEQWK